MQGSKDELTMLVQMSPAMFEVFKARTITGFADDSRRVTQLGAAESLSRANAEFERLLPLGLATRGHYFFSIEPPSVGKSVGSLWFAVIDQDQRQVGFIYDLQVDAPFRRHGYARQALSAIENHARSLGLSTLRLHTFGHNVGAEALYRKVGFEPINIVMEKAIDAGPE